MRILITGGTGFVGSHLLGQLLKQSGSQFAILAVDEPAVREPGVDYHRLDILDAEAVRAIVRQFQPDHIYHLAGVATMDGASRQPSLAYEVSVLGTHNLLDAAMNGPRPPRILYVSTSHVYGRSSRKLTEESPLGPANPYAASKAMAELLAFQYRGRDKGGVITVRSFSHTGPGQTPDYVFPNIAKQFAEIEAGLRPPKLILGNLNSKRDFSDIRDAVRAYCMVLEQARAGEVYNVCSGTAVALADIVEMFRALSNTKVEIVQDPSRVRSDEIPEICGDATKIHADTGWKPEISLEQTIKDLLDYWRLKCRSQGAAVSP